MSSSEGTKADRGQLLRFLVSGSSAVATDTTIYWLCLPYLPPSAAKAVSFISGTLVAYVLNKFWTFKVPHRSHAEIVKFGCLYLSTLGINVLVNRVILNCLPAFLPGATDRHIMIAFFCATGTSTVLNYLGQRFWVFRKTKITRVTE